MLIFLQKNADIIKVNRAMVLKGIFSETTYACVLMMCMYVCTKFEVSSSVLTSFRRGGDNSIHLKINP